VEAAASTPASRGVSIREIRSGRIDDAPSGAFFSCHFGFFPGRSTTLTIQERSEYDTLMGMPEILSTITPAGQRYIDADPALQDLIERFWESPEPEMVLGGVFIGAERYSKVCRVGGLAIKVSSPTSSRDSDEQGRPLRAENLVNQFNYLTALRQHLQERDPSIVVPEQFFVLRSRHKAYLAGMTHMEDWLPYHTWMPERFGEVTSEARDFADSIRQRILNAVHDSPLRDGLTDLKLDRDQLHGGNILLPASHGPGPDTPLCIIDQPGRQPKTTNMGFDLQSQS
jgi:hypothetical protein